MSDRDEQIIRAEAALQQEEKKFLMEKYVSMLLLQVNEDDSESDDADDLDDETVESLLVARPYVSGEVAQQIADLLTAKGHEFEEDEEEGGGGSNGHDAFEADDSGDFADDGNGEQVEGLFDEDGEAGADDPVAMAASLELDEDTPVDDNTESEQHEETSEAAEEEDAEGLFEDAESDSTDAVVAADEGEDEDEGEEVEGLFDEEDDGSHEPRSKVDGEADGADDSVAADREDGEEDEEAGVLFQNDIYSGNAGSGRKDADSEEAEEGDGFTPTEGHEVEETAGFTPTEGHEIEETPGFTPTEGHEVEETAGFTPTEGHEVEETPGFTPTEGHEVEETAGFTPTVGHEVEETAGFTPTVGHEVEETPGFTPTVGHEVEETPGFTPTQGHEVEETAGFTPTVGTRSKKHRDSRRPWVMKETPGLTPEKGKNGKKKKKGAGITPGQETESEAAAPGASPAQDAAEEKLKGRRPKKSKEEEVEDPVEKEKREREARKLASAEERAAKLKKAQEERRARLKKTQLEQKGIKQEEEEEPAEELELDDLMYQVSVDDLQQYLGISVIPDDRARLDRRWAMKVRDPSLRQLLADAKAMEHGYALIPRLPRYLKDGKIVQNNFVTIVRSFPQLFDNVAQIINKYKAEPFFVSEMPELDWAIVACEVLPESRNRSFMEQKTVVKQYAQKYRANDMRIQRRKLIEALYDVVMVNAITKENILKETVDLTATNVGRQNFACINFGEKGIRINDISRQQKHQQMGTCPAW